MKIVIAPDSYKESLSAIEVAEAIESGFKKVFPNYQYVKCPVADGGEGSVEALVDASGGEMVHTDVIGPLGDHHESNLFSLPGGDGAVVRSEVQQGSLCVHAPRLGGHTCRAHLPATVL